MDRAFATRNWGNAGVFMDLQASTKSVLLSVIASIQINL